MIDEAPNKVIARALAISERTAKFHVDAVLGKLHARNRAEAVAIAPREGFDRRMDYRQVSPNPRSLAPAWRPSAATASPPTPPASSVAGRAAMRPVRAFSGSPARREAA